MALQISGKFNSIDNSTYYRVSIYRNTGSVGYTTYTIKDGNENNFNRNAQNIMFAPNPVTISYDFSDPFTHIKISSATISLISNMNLVELFGKNTSTGNQHSKTRVVIQRYRISTDEHVSYNDGSIFNGFIEDEIFQQEYSYAYSMFTFHAIDPLSTLKYKDIKDTTNDNNEYIPEGLLDLWPLSMFNPNSWIVRYNKLGYPIQDSRYNYQNLLSMNNHNLKFNPDVFGLNVDILDKRSTIGEINEEILKYLNLYAAYWPGHEENTSNMAEGIFNYFSCHFWPATYDYTHRIGNPIHITKNDAVSNDTSLTLSESFSVIKLTCDIEPVEKLVDFGDDTTTDTGLKSPYRNKQKYMTEIFSLGEGDTAADAFYDMVVDNKESSYDAAYTIDNYVYVKKSDAWDFSAGYEGNERNAQDYTTQIQMGNDNWGRNQHNILSWMAQDTTKIRPAWVAFGRSSKQDVRDDSPANSIKMTDYLYIPIWGTETHEANTAMQTKFNRYTSSHPLVKYTPYQNISLTPTDSNVTNYIVISGKILLNPLQQVTGTNWCRPLDPFYVGYQRTDSESTQRNYPWLWYIRSTNMYSDTVNLITQKRKNYQTVPHPENGDGAYYTQLFYSCSDVKENDYMAIGNVKWAYGFLDNSKNKQMEYSYSLRDENNVDEGGESIDKINKIALLKCELKVGDKYCCEIQEGTDEVFKWYTAEEAQALGVEPVMYLGINPKVGDFIIGTSFDIKNMISDRMNLEGTGLAIPITSEDLNVSGTFSFKIITPMNPVWEDVERIHPSFWRHTSWNVYYRYIMEKTQAIMLESLKIEVQNDNALADKEMTTSDNDLVYSSDMNPYYKEAKEIELKICSGLSSDECHDYAIANEVSNTFVIDGNNGDAPYLGEIDNSVQEGEYYIKQEQKIVDAMWKATYKPYTIINTSIKSDKINELNILNYCNDLFYLDYWKDNVPVKINKVDFELKTKTAECEFKEFDTSIINQ